MNTAENDIVNCALRHTLYGTGKVLEVSDKAIIIGFNMRITIARKTFQIMDLVKETGKFYDITEKALVVFLRRCGLHKCDHCGYFFSLPNIWKEARGVLCKTCWENEQAVLAHRREQERIEKEKAAAKKPIEKKTKNKEAKIQKAATSVSEPVNTLLIHCDSCKQIFRVRVDSECSPFECPQCGQRYLIHKKGSKITAINSQGLLHFPPKYRTAIKKGELQPKAWSCTVQGIKARSYAWESLVMQALLHVQKRQLYSRYMFPEIETISRLYKKITLSQSLDELYNHIYQIVMKKPCVTEWQFDTASKNAWRVSVAQHGKEKILLQQWIEPVVIPKISQRESTTVQNSKRVVDEPGQSKIVARQPAASPAVVNKKNGEKLYLIPQGAHECAACSGKLRHDRVNIPVYDNMGKYQGVYINNAFLCENCGRHYLPQDEMQSFVARIGRLMAHKFGDEWFYIGVGETGFYKAHSAEYLNADVVKEKIVVTTSPAKYREAGESDRWANMSPVSFLGEMGYSVKRTTENRRVILKKAVALYGKRKILDHIRGQISLREHQVRDYSSAISIWESDIEYIIYDI